MNTKRTLADASLQTLRRWLRQGETTFGPQSGTARCLRRAMANRKGQVSRTKSDESTSVTVLSPPPSIASSESFAACGANCNCRPHSPRTVDTPKRDFAEEIANSESARRLIRSKIFRLIRRPAFRHCDLDDLSQEFWQHFIKKAKRFDPAKGSLDAFLALVADQFAANLIRDKEVKDRACGHVESLDVHIDGDVAGPSTVAESISHRELDRRRRCERRPEWDRIDLTLDLEEFICTLPPKQRHLARSLLSDCLASIAR